MPGGVAARFYEAALLMPEIGALGWCSGARSFDSGAERSQRTARRTERLAQMLAKAALPIPGAISKAAHAGGIAGQGA